MTDALDAPIHLTPLADAHRELGARLIEFGGWLMPVQYGSIIEEHRAVRERVGLFDLSHMGELYVEGPEAGPALAAALVSDPPSLAVGRAHYSMICAPDGGIIDDLIVYRLGETRFLVVANAGNAAVVSDALAERLARLQGRSSTIGRWRPACWRSRGRAPSRSSRPLTDVDLGALRYYAAAEGTVAGISGLVARTGYTGEDGFELFVEHRPTEAAVGGAARRRARGRRACRSVWARATRCGSRPACRSTATSSTSTRTRTRPGWGGWSSSTSPATSSGERRSRRSRATGLPAGSSG